MTSGRPDDRTFRPRARGAVGFHIVRHYYDQLDRAFEVTLTVYPPDRMEHSFDLVLSGATAGHSAHSAHDAHDAQDAQREGASRDRGRARVGR